MVAMTHRHQRVFKSPITPVNSYSFYCLWEENQNKKSCFPKRSERETFAYITVLQVRYQGTNVLLTFKTNLLSCQKKKSIWRRQRWRCKTDCQYQAYSQQRLFLKNIRFEGNFEKNSVLVMFLHFKWGLWKVPQTLKKNIMSNEEQKALSTSCSVMKGWNQYQCVQNSKDQDFQALMNKAWCRTLCPEERILLNHYITAHPKSEYDLKFLTTLKDILVEEFYFSEEYFVISVLRELWGRNTVTHLEQVHWWKVIGQK